MWTFHLPQIPGLLQNFHRRLPKLFTQQTPHGSRDQYNTETGLPDEVLVPHGQLQRPGPVGSPGGFHLEPAVSAGAGQVPGSDVVHALLHYTTGTSLCADYLAGNQDTGTWVVETRSS